MRLSGLPGLPGLAGLKNWCGERPGRPGRRGRQCRPGRHGAFGRGDRVAHAIAVTVNGTTHRHEVEPRLLLVYYLREVLGLTGTHIGCDTTSCGTCTIIMNGQAVKSCTLLAVQADGAQILTVEGLAQNGILAPIQEGIWEKHGPPRGVWTSGLMVGPGAV